MEDRLKTRQGLIILTKRKVKYHHLTLEDQTTVIQGYMRPLKWRFNKL